MKNTFQCNILVIVPKKTQKVKQLLAIYKKILMPLLFLH